jgi:hypothetical protein
MTNLHFMCAAQFSDERELSAHETSVVMLGPSQPQYDELSMPMELCIDRVTHRYTSRTRIVLKFSQNSEDLLGREG